MAENESIWARLTRLFRSGPVVRHKVASGERNYEPQGTALAYKRELSNLYANSLASYGQYERLARYGDYSEMCYCLAPGTLIAVPGGYRTIKELADECTAKRADGLDDSFVVFSYDHEKGKIVPAKAKHARMTRHEVVYRVTFDDGRYIDGTADHRLMLRDGSYRKIYELTVGTSMMPFKRKNLFSNPYTSYYDGTKWVHEHRALGAFIEGRELTRDEVVHHVNEVKSDNRIENLQVMTVSEHRSNHAREYNKLKWSSNNEAWIEKFKAQHSKFMTENSPNARRDITFAGILQVAEKNDFHLFKTIATMGIEYPMIMSRLKQQSFKNWEAFARAYSPTWKNHGQDNTRDKNPRWDDTLDFQKICDAFEPGMSVTALIKKLNTTGVKIKNRVREHGFETVQKFCKNYSNCRVRSVDKLEAIDVYDLTVDGYKNFATDTVVSHNTPEICSALDIYAEEVTCANEDGEIIKILSPSDTIKEILETFFYDVLNIEFNIYNWVRNLCKTGDFCLFVDASESNGILNLLPIPINEIEREEGYDKNDPFAVRFRWLTQGNMILQNWQIIHFRLLGDDGFLPYGTSVIEPARRIWRQLILIEDAMLVYRIVRSPERRMFKIPVGNLSPEDVERHMEDIKNKLKRNQIVDSSSGRVEQRYNPLAVDDDYFLPTRNGEGPTIETLPGGQFVGDIEDVQYIQSKLFAALKVPKAWLSYEGDLGSKATLSQLDVRFAKTTERIQKIVVAELEKIAIIHLFLLGYSGENLANFKIEMAAPSTIAEQQHLELWRMRFEVAGMAQEGIFDRETIYRDIFKRNDAQIAKIKEGKRFDALEDKEIEAVKNGTPPEATPAGGAAPLGGGEPVPGEEQLPTTLGGETPPAEETKPEAFDLAGMMLTERNPGSEGDDAFIAVDKGKDLFSTGEDQLALTFGTEKQTASDPFDKRAQKRLVTRPFSEALEHGEETSTEPDAPAAWIESALDRIGSLDETIRRDLSVLVERFTPAPQKRRGRRAF